MIEGLKCRSVGDCVVLFFKVCLVCFPLFCGCGVILGSILCTLGINFEYNWGPRDPWDPLGVPLGDQAGKSAKKLVCSPPSPRGAHFEAFSTKPRHKVDCGRFFRGRVREKYVDSQTWLFRPHSVAQRTLENTKIELNPNRVVQKQRAPKPEKGCSGKK